MMKLLLWAVCAGSGREGEKYKGLYTNVCLVKQDWLSLMSMHSVLFFYVYSVYRGQTSPNVQYLVWLLDVKEVANDDKSRVSTLCVKISKKNYS
jgi:hypothetical protein